MNAQLSEIASKFGVIVKTKEFWAGVVIGFFIGAILM